MSCQVLDFFHIESLLSTAINGPSDTVEAIKMGRFHPIHLLLPGDVRVRLVVELADEIGKHLLKANLVAWELHDKGRVPDSLDEEVESFTFRNRGRMTAVQALKALQAFEYNCDPLFDHPNVLPELQMEIKEFIHDLRRHLIQVLPGYEEAAWFTEI